MKTILIGLTAVVLASGTALAAPGHGTGYGYGTPHAGRVTPAERIAIARSASHVAILKRMALRDGRVTIFERMQINRAERQHAILVARARRT